MLHCTINVKDIVALHNPLPRPPICRRDATQLVGLQFRSSVMARLVRSVIRPVVAVRPIVGVRRIGRRVINGRRWRIVGIDRRVVCVGRWIHIAAIPTSSPANFFYGGL